MNQSLIKDIPVESNLPIAHMFRITDVELRDTKTGKKYLLFNLGDSSGSIKAKKWDADEEQFERFRKSRILFVTGKTDIYNGSLSIVCETMAEPEEETAEEFLSALLPSTQYDIKLIKKEVWAYVQGMSNSFIRQLTEMMLTDDYVKSRLAKVPGGLQVHHSYRGGLLVHIYRLLKVGEGLVDALNNNLYPGSNPVSVNKDIVYFGLICHDLFKVSEYSPELSYENDGNLVGHLPLGAIEINRKMDKIDNFPDEIRKQLTHVLLSHHGQLKFGSPVTPKTLESNIVHYLDLMMSRVDPILEAVQGLNEGENWTVRLKSIDGQQAYRGGQLID